MTARWVVDVVAPERDLDITWEPISLLVKNEPSEDSPFYAANVFTHKLLRVMLAVEAAEGNAAAGRLYWQYGAVIHHDRVDGVVDLGQVIQGDATRFLEAADLSPDYNDAFEDESWDEQIRSRMQAGLDLVGTDVGTPIIAFDTPNGRAGVFGPVISRMLDGPKIWDAMVTLATAEGFWELKRTRTEDPQFPARP
jgi:hypothetical protein